MSICSISSLSLVKSEAYRWVRHHMYFPNTALFLVGLVLGHGLVKNAVVDVIMLYLSENWKHVSLMKLAAIVNGEEAISGVIAIVVSVITDAWLGRFKMVLFTTPSFILGLVLLWFSTWLFTVEMKAPVSYVALLLISFGKAGKDPPFKNFFEDQLRKKEEGDEQVYDGSIFWWRVFKFIGAVISVFFFTKISWKNNFLFSASVMGATYLLLLAGIFWRTYNCTPPSRSPFTVLHKVVKAAFAKRALNYPPTPSGYFLNQQNEQKLFPCDPFLRCIDKAAIIEQASPNQQVEVKLQDEYICTVAEVRQAKSFVRLIPLWFAFILYGIVTAAGTTFFIEQSSGLNEYIGDNFRFPVNALFIMRSFTSSIISFLASLILLRYCARNKTWKLRGGLIRVGIGIGISIVCCEYASNVEGNRLDLIHQYGNPDTRDVVLPMSIILLAPQFIFLGLMDGLAEDGLSDLFYLLSDESMEGIETPMNQLVLGIGKVMSVGCVFIFRSWFGDTINTSRLDKYFLMLMHISAGNLVFYVLLAQYYFHINEKESNFKSNYSGQDATEREEDQKEEQDDDADAEEGLGLCVEEELEQNYISQN